MTLEEPHNFLQQERRILAVVVGESDEVRAGVPEPHVPRPRRASQPFPQVEDREQSFVHAYDRRQPLIRVLIYDKQLKAPKGLRV
jgi:hypothetical protein